MEKKISITGDLSGGFAAMLVAMPSAIAYGMIIFAPLGNEFASKGAVAGIIGSIVLGLTASVFGGTPRLISSPCAPAAAVLSVFVMETMGSGIIPREMIPLYVGITALGAGLIQLAAGLAKGGTFIKYIPYPVVAGYLSGVGLLIFLGQLPKFLGIPKGSSLFQGVINPAIWSHESIIIGSVTIAVMLAAPYVIKSFPASIAALLSGIGCYFILSVFNKNLLIMENNPFIIGKINASIGDIGTGISTTMTSALSLNPSDLMLLVVPVLTLGTLLSIDTLKTCVVLDVITGTRHDSNRELFGQGLANIAASLLGGVPGSGTMGGTLVNIYSGGRTRMSGVVAGLSSLAVLILFINFISWIPLASLAGVLLIVGVRMIDRKGLHLLKHRSTRFDFFVILAVVVAALSMSLIAAAGVGISLAIALFLREQLRFPVIRRSISGSMIFSKKNRLASEHAILEEKGKETIVIELQGQLFFGTTDQLYTEIEPYIGMCRFFIIDMRRVLSVDFTAANMLTQIKTKIAETNGLLILTSVPKSVPTGQNVQKYLKNLGFTPEDQRVVIFRELDEALEWAEDQYLKENSLESAAAVSLDLAEFEFFTGASASALATIAGSIEEKKYSSGDKIFKYGDTGGEIYFIKKGGVRIKLPLANGTSHHITSFGRGDFFGDMSFLNMEMRSADAIADGEVELYIMRRSNFDKISTQYPEIAGIFYYRLAYEISRRLRLNLIELKALEEN